MATPQDRIKQLEDQVQKLGEEVAKERVKREELEKDIETQAYKLAEDQLKDYKAENWRYVEALQTIADGKGKYAKVAKDAL